MKQFLLTASACIGLFAFTRVGVSHVRNMSTASILSDTTKKPKPDSIQSIVFVPSASMDTTKKPKPDSIRAIGFVPVAAMDTTKPKPDSTMLAMR